MTLKVKVNPPIFNASWENLKMHIWFKLGGCSLNALPVIAQTNQAKFPKILSKNG